MGFTKSINTACVGSFNVWVVRSCSFSNAPVSIKFHTNPVCVIHKSPILRWALVNTLLDHWPLLMIKIGSPDDAWIGLPTFANNEDERTKTNKNSCARRAIMVCSNLKKIMRSQFLIIIPCREMPTCYTKIGDFMYDSYFSARN